MSAILAPTADGESNRPLMAASIGVCIVAAREVGKPDPSDDELRRGLRADGFLEIEIRDGFAHAKAMALAAVKDAAALGALALFIGAACLWLPVFAGA